MEWCYGNPNSSVSNFGGFCFGWASWTNWRQEFTHVVSVTNQFHRFPAIPVLASVMGVNPRSSANGHDWPGEMPSPPCLTWVTPEAWGSTGHSFNFFLTSFFLSSSILPVKFTKFRPKSQSRRWIFRWTVVYFRAITKKIKICRGKFLYYYKSLILFQLQLQLGPCPCVATGERKIRNGT